MNATVGESYGAIKGTNYVYNDNGDKIVVPHGDFGANDTDGDGVVMNFHMVLDMLKPLFQVIGNILPDWTGGITNTLTYKNITASALIDMQWGGSFFSLDTWYGYGTGIYDLTAGTNDDGNPVRNSIADGGGIEITGVTSQFIR